MIVLVFAELTCALESTMMSVAFGHLYGLYGDPVHVGWTMTAFALTSAASAAVCGRLGDLYGRVRVLTFMLGVAAAGSLIGLFATDLNVVIAGRALQGASMAILPLAFGILREHASKPQVDIGIGILGGTFSLGSGLGLLAGGVIIDNYHWQYIFAISSIVALVALALVIILLPKGRGSGVGVPRDIWGGVLFVLPLTAFLLGINFASKFGWSAMPFALGAGGLLGLVAWTWREWRHPDPLIDVKQLRRPQIGIVNAAIFFTAMGALNYPQVVLPLLQQPVWTGIGLGFSATMIGMIKFPSNIYAMFASIGAGYLARAITMRRVLILASATGAGSWILLTLKHDTAWMVLGVLLIFIVPCLTISFACSPALIVAAAPPDRTSEATGLSQVIRAIGTGVGAQLIGYAIASSAIGNAAGQRFPDEHAYQLTLAVIAGCSVLSLICMILVPLATGPPKSSVGIGEGVDARKSIASNHVEH